MIIEHFIHFVQLKLRWSMNNQMFYTSQKFTLILQSSYTLCMLTSAVHYSPLPETSFVTVYFRFGIDMGRIREIQYIFIILSVM